MASAAGSMIMTAPRTVHPFFERSLRTPSFQSWYGIFTEQHLTDNETVGHARPTHENQKSRLEPDEPSPAKLSSTIIAASIQPAGNVDSANTSNNSLSQVSDESGSRKRRKLDNKEVEITEEVSSQMSDDVSKEATILNLLEDHNDNQAGDRTDITTVSGEPTINLHEQESSNLSTHELSQPAEKTKASNVLQLDGRGRFSSTMAKPKRKSETEPGDDRLESKPKTRRVRRQRAIAILRYGILDIDRRCEIGSRIQKLLNTPQSSARVLEAVTPIKSLKPAHPFFYGKPVNSDVQATEKANKVSDNPFPSIESPNKRTFTTPGKFKQFLRLSKPDSHSSVRTTSGLNRSFNLPGTHESPFPWQGFSSSSPSALRTGAPNDLGEVPCRRKRKNKPFHVSSEENLLSILCQSLRRSRAFELSEECEQNGSPRCPQRLLVSGFELQQHIKAELADSVVRAGPVSKFFDKLTSSLSAYDKGLCEAHSWLQKYAPQCAEDVLQSTPETHILSDWLESLTIDAVHKGTAQGGAESFTVIKASKRNSNLRRRKSRKDDMDDFIVHDDDDDDELHEIHSADDPDEPEADQSLVRGSGSSYGRQRTSRCMVISGPPGSGKTAAVYAVAKALGFEIFEINAGGRRAGKDILEKIGDMTFNHQVPKASNVLDEREIDMADKMVLDSAPESNQKSLTSFFGSSSKVVKPKPASKQPKVTPKTIEAKARRQKQSLILFEEVDTLFDDDKQFWETVMALCATSKRPLILTCKDEALVPIGSLSPHGILRFRPCSIDLSADYLLVVAALEGHLLQRKDVLDMLRSCQNDFRAAMTTLNFWCQIGVGDQKGGLDWIFQRWPKGVDIDEHGNTLRVISKGTCPSGINWISCNVAHDPSISKSQKRERFVDFLTTQLDTDMSRAAKYAGAPTESDAEFPLADRGNHGHVRNLLALEHFTQTRSAADTMCKVDIPGRLHYHGYFDPTGPPLLESARHNYVSGYPLLQTDPFCDYSRTGASIYSALHWGSIADSSSDPEITAAKDTTLDDDFERFVLNPEFPSSLRRFDFDKTFEPVAGQPDPTGSYTGEFQQSSFDRNLSIIATEIAPYVRCIVAYDIQLEEFRHRISGAVGNGDQPGRRVRTTRASRSALEGSQRSVTRRERWFPKALDPKAVLRTGNPEWPQSSAFSVASTRESSVVAIETSSQEI